MDIRYATSKYKKAQEANAAGNHFLAAQLYLFAQQCAMDCRSAKRYSLIDHSHLGACMSVKRVLDSVTDNNIRSEAGRIRSASVFHYVKGY